MTEPAAAVPSPSNTSVPQPLLPHRGMWFGLLTVYLTLFLLIGYLAFLMPSPNPGTENHREIAQIEDAETRAFFIDSLKMENAEHTKQRDLATQSFNVVLGALLGFLSSSATFYMRRPHGADDPTPETNP